MSWQQYFFYGVVLWLMKTFTLTFCCLCLTLPGFAGCYYDPSISYYKVVSGTCIYDSTNRIYYKAPKDTLETSLSVAIIGYCAGNTSDAYYFNDSLLPPGSNIDFFHISMPGLYTVIAYADWGGAYSFSIVIRDSIFAPPAPVLPPATKILSNPFTDEIALSCIRDSVTQFNYVIYDMSGTQILSGIETLIKGDNAVAIATEGIPTGLYILVIHEGVTTDRLRLVKY